MSLLSVLSSDSSESSRYSCLLLHPVRDLLFAGTTDGVVEVWDLDDFSKKAKLRYLVLDEYGEAQPVEEEIVQLAAPLDFTLVYAFMGNAAYCIDVDLLTIVEKVPISEDVVSGNIGPQSGDIGVITQPGYLSRWSPKFVERVSSIDLPYDVDSCYLLHDFDETRVLLIFPDDSILIASLSAEPYTLELSMPGVSQLVDGVWYDRNGDYQVIINEFGNIDIYNNSSDVPGITEDDLLFQGKSAAEMEVREFVLQIDTSEDRREYITDFRLNRQSRDRYVAEVEKLQDDSKYKGTIAEDSKTLHFAMKETKVEDIDAKTTAYSIIEKISHRHEIDPRYVFFASRLGTSPTQIIETARYYEFEADRRQSRITSLLASSMVLAFVLLMVSELVIFTTTSLVIFGLLVLVEITLVYMLSSSNTKPKIPGIKEYKAFYWLILAAILVSCGLVFYNSFLDQLSNPI